MVAETDIVSLDFELIVYRKGNLHAHVNLKRGYLTWRDSWQWSNNFTRTLSDEQVQSLRQLVEHCKIRHKETHHDKDTNTQERKPDDPDFDPVSWLITIRQAKHSWLVRGYGSVPDCWQPLKELIEQVSRICFFL